MHQKKKKKAIFGLGNIVSSIPWLCRIEGSRVAQDPRETKGWACLDSAVTLQSPLRVSLPGARPRPSGLGAEDVVRAVSPACVSTGTRKGGAVLNPSPLDPHSHLLPPEAAGPSGQASAQRGPHGAPASHGEPALLLAHPECGRDARQPAWCQAPGQGPGRRDEWPGGRPTAVAVIIFGWVPAALPLLPG